MVLGTKPYWVSVEARQFNLATCNCYLGQNDALCKHMVAVAIYAVKEGKPLNEGDKKLVSGPECSNRQGELSKTELAKVKKSITSAMRYIKAYHGPSRIWSSYQNSLSEGCNRLSAIVSELPVSEQTAKLLVNLLLRLDKKLCQGGVDDSDGTVGEFITETVTVLKKYSELDPACKRALKILKNRETCFGWEENLLNID